MMKKKMNLTGKIYTIELLSGMIFYGIGILLITPPTNPLVIKYIGVGSLIVLQLVIIIFTMFRNSEKLDERALVNVYKASNLTVFILFFLFFVSGVVIQIFSLKISFSAAISAFILAIMLVTHSTVFRTLENLGK